jgi:hypothetical protein
VVTEDCCTASNGARPVGRVGALHNFQRRASGCMMARTRLPLKLHHGIQGGAARIESIARALGGRTDDGR